MAFILHKSLEHTDLLCFTQGIVSVLKDLVTVVYQVESVVWLLLLKQLKFGSEVGKPLQQQCFPAACQNGRCGCFRSFRTKEIFHTRAPRLNNIYSLLEIILQKYVVFIQHLL